MALNSLTVATRNTLLDSIGIKSIQLHSADPTEAGTAGAIAGAKKAFTLPGATGGALQTASGTTIEIDVTVSGTPITVSHYTLWDNNDPAAVGAKCVATGSLSASQNYTATGKYIVNSLTVDLNK